MKKIATSPAVFRFYPIAAGLGMLFLAPGLTHMANAQSGVVVDTSQHFSYADNQGIVYINTSQPGVSTPQLDDFYLGSQNTTAEAPGSPNLPSGTFQTYCVDAFSDLQHTQTVTVQQLNSSFNLGQGSSGVNVGGAIAWLYNNDAGLITDFSQASADESAALQLSIWEVEYNWTGVGMGGIDPTLMSGNIQYIGNPNSFPPVAGQYNTAVTAQIRTDAENLLDAWNGQTDNGTLLSTAPGLDDQSLVGPKANFSAAPEPGSAAFVAVPFLGLLIGRVVRRRRRNG